MEEVDGNDSEEDASGDEPSGDAAEVRALMGQNKSDPSSEVRDLFKDRSSLTTSLVAAADRKSVV